MKFDLGVCFRKGHASPRGAGTTPDGNCSEVKGFAAFAKAPLGEALISYVGTEGRDLPAAAAVPVQALPVGCVRSCRRKLLSELVEWQLTSDFPR